MNTSRYFPHNINAHNDDKLLGVRMDLGCEGYGIYFLLLEQLGETEDYTCSADYKRLAYSFHCDEAKVKAIVENYGLFEFVDDGKRFYSKSYNERMQIRDEKSEKLSEIRRKAAQARWGNKENTTENQPVNANAMQTDANAMQNDAKETKLNKIKRKKESTLTCTKESDAAVAATNVQKDEEKEVDAVDDSASALVLSPPKVSLADKQAARARRENVFFDSLVPYVDQYGREMIRAFYNYWSEPNKSGTQMRFEMQPTFELSRRLATWAKRDNKPQTPSSNGTVTATKQRNPKFADFGETLAAIDAGINAGITERGISPSGN